MPRNQAPHSRLRPSRRTSFARRDSNLALLGAVFSGVVLAFALLLLVIQRVNPEMGSSLRGATAYALSPIISVVRAPIDAVRGFGEFLRDHSNVVERNRALEAELKAADTKIAHVTILEEELQRLQALVALRRPERRLVASGVASANSANAGQRTAIVSVGFEDGVLPRMPVIAAHGLAGRITDVGTGASRMMLLTDGNSRVPVRVLRTGWTGLAVGTGGPLLDFEFDVASGTDTIKVGDKLVTSGDGGLFPPGIPVAVIHSTDGSVPKARPIANPTGLGTVTIEAPWLAPVDFIKLPDAQPEADLPVAAQPTASTPAIVPTATSAPVNARAPRVPQPGIPDAVRPATAPAAPANPTPTLTTPQ